MSNNAHPTHGVKRPRSVFEEELPLTQTQRFEEEEDEDSTIDLTTPRGQSVASIDGDGIPDGDRDVSAPYLELLGESEIVDDGKGHIRWAFTFFRIGDSTDDEYLVRLQSYKTVRCAVFQREVCPQTGRDHLQGYLEFKRSEMFETVRRRLQAIMPGVRVVPAVKCRLANYRYCTKSGTRKEGHSPKEFGEFVATRPGARTDLEEIRELIENDVPMKDIARDHFKQWCRYNRAFDRYATMLRANIGIRPIVVELRIGPTWTGKSDAVFAARGDSWFEYSQATSGTYFDGYDGEKVLILDEFRGCMPLAILLRVLDKYPYKLPCRGYSVDARYNKVLITSNVWPQDWYPKCTERLDNLLRRVHNFYIHRRNEEPLLFQRLDDKAINFSNLKLKYSF